MQTTICDICDKGVFNMRREVSEVLQLRSHCFPVVFDVGIDLCADCYNDAILALWTKLTKIDDSKRPM